MGHIRHLLLVICCIQRKVGHLQRVRQVVDHTVKQQLHSLKANAGKARVGERLEQTEGGPINRTKLGNNARVHQKLKHAHPGMALGSNLKRERT